MKKLFLILSAVILLNCCTPAKFIVTSKEPTGIEDNCIVGLKPINKKAFKLALKDTIDGALVNCDGYIIGDTLILTRKDFINY